MLAATIVMAIATIVLVLFTAATWKILVTQHKLYNDPELKIHPWPEADIATTVNGLAIVGLAATDEEKRSNAQYVEYRVALVNPGAVPITVTAIREEAIIQQGARQELAMRFTSPPERRPARVFMLSVPWVITGQYFGLCRRYLSFLGEYQGLGGQEFRVRVTVEYHNGQRSRSAIHHPPLRWGFDAPEPAGGYDALESG